VPKTGWRSVNQITRIKETTTLVPSQPGVEFDPSDQGVEFLWPTTVAITGLVATFAWIVFLVWFVMKVIF
jgi:hypothetical protein